MTETWHFLKIYREFCGNLDLIACITLAKMFKPIVSNIDVVFLELLDGIMDDGLIQ